MFIEINKQIIDLGKIAKINRSKKWIYFYGERSVATSNYPITIANIECDDEYTAEKLFDNIIKHLQPTKITVL